MDYFIDYLRLFDCFHDFFYGEGRKDNTEKVRELRLLLLCKALVVLTT